MSFKDQLSQLVYSTEQGKIVPEPAAEQIPETDGTIRIWRETKGRKGKGVTVLNGFGLPKSELKEIARKLKQTCGVGGSQKEYQIEIQGEQREQCAAYLTRQGFKVKVI